MALTRFSTSEKSTGLAPPRTSADINKRVTAVRYETGNLLDRAAAKSSPRQEGEECEYCGERRQFAEPAVAGYEVARDSGCGQDLVTEESLRELLHIA